MRTILVTGGCGFIGSAFVRRVVGGNLARIVNVDKLTYAANPDAVAGVASRPGYAFVQADIGDRAAMRDIFATHRPDAIVNFAAETHVDRSIDGPLAFVETNVAATVRLLVETLDFWRSLPEGARAGFRFLHVSTDEVFGALGTDDPPFIESTPYAPNSPYAATKAASDHLVRAWMHTYGLPAIVTNCSNNYGPWQFPEKLIPLMIARATAGERLPVYGAGTNIRDWLHVDDHAAGLWLALTRGRPGETYAFGGGAERPNLDVVHLICDRLDARLGELSGSPRRALVEFVVDRPGHDFRYAIDATKARTELAWTPAHDFEDGLSGTIDWYLDHSDWVEAIRRRRYALGRLGTG
ncbi:MAG: dTDP-glucose 4,6-dehydratase [Alphaproteobacteria bacterium]|nr:dTDP-glucose 4,6-dehydratase [Alphaproteobacteria bacterium]